MTDPEQLSSGPAVDYALLLEFMEGSLDEAASKQVFWYCLRYKPWYDALQQEPAELTQALLEEFESFCQAADKRWVLLTPVEIPRRLAAGTTKSARLLGKFDGAGMTLEITESVEPGRVELRFVGEIPETFYRLLIDGRPLELTRPLEGNCTQARAEDLEKAISRPGTVEVELADSDS